MLDGFFNMMLAKSLSSGEPPARRGSFRKPASMPPRERFDIAAFRAYLSLRKSGLMNLKCNFHEYNFLKEMSVEDAQDLWNAAFSDSEFSLWDSSSDDIERFLRKHNIRY